MMMHLALAVLLFAQTADVGVVNFQNSGAPAAQGEFLRGLALLHNFEYSDAAESFRNAQKIDPQFAMAYWGEAMTYTHPIWMQQDLDAARAVVKKMPAAKTERERDYIHTVEVLYGDGTKEERDFKFADAMAALHAKYPADVDATAFYALSLLGTAHEGRDFATYMRAAALLEEVFPANLRHPGVLHYLIHSYDDPIHAPLGLRAARLYGSVAPHAPHALHMTSHIFVAMGMWDDVIDANQKAIAAQSKTSGCGHYPLWLEYGYLQKKNFVEAKKVLDACQAANAGSVSYAEMRANFVASGGDPGPLTVTNPVPEARLRLAYADALAAARRNDAAALADAASRLTPAEGAKPVVLERAAIVRQEVDALRLSLQGKHDEAIAILRKAADAERSMAFEFGPPVIEKPPLELLADELMAAGRAGEAKQAYEAALARTPGRTLAVEGLQRARKAAR
jgi:tetratricopeptide (TPR) repeat protein